MVQHQQQGLQQQQRGPNEADAQAPQHHQQLQVCSKLTSSKVRSKVYFTQLMVQPRRPNTTNRQRRL
jgi:hypothetical protein